MRIMHSVTGTMAIGGLLALLALGSARTSAAEDAAGTLRGVARLSDGPAANAEVVAGIIGCAPTAGDFAATTQTDADGRFSLDRAPLGPIDVWVRAKGAKWKFALRMSHPSVNDLEIDARPNADTDRFGGFGGASERTGTITGTVTDKAGKVIVGAAAGLRGDDKTWVLTDDKGQFTLERAGDGDGLAVRAKGYREFLVQKVKLDKKRIAVKLAPVKPTVVHVTDPGGQPLAGAWVVLGSVEDVQGTTGFSSMFPPRARLVGGWADAKGDASVVWEHGENKTVATAYSLLYAPATKSVVAGGAAVSLKLTPKRPMRATATLREGGAPIAGVYVGLPHESDGGADAISALPQDDERGPIIVGKTDENGQCVISDLAANVTTLRVVGEQKIHAVVKLEPVTDLGGR